MFCIQRTDALHSCINAILMMLVTIKSGNLRMANFSTHLRENVWTLPRKSTQLTGHPPSFGIVLETTTKSGKCWKMDLLSTRAQRSVWTQIGVTLGPIGYIPPTWVGWMR